MGRKDATNATSLPIDSYRKQIGRHDQQKEKRGPGGRLKAQKEAKNNAVPIKEIILLLFTILGLLACIYVLVYVYLAPDENLPPPQPAQSAS